MNYLIVDIGSSSGKVYLANIADKKMVVMEEVDRFETERSFFMGHISTNIFYIYDRICQTIRRTAGRGIKIDALGIDSWCGDYSLIDLDNGSIGMPVFYRDHRTDGYMEKIHEIMNYEDIYRLTTQRKTPDSTLCQLMAYKDEHKKGLEGNKKILFIGDLLMYFFTGVLCSEVSVASYSQLYSMKKRGWENEIFDTFKIPRTIQPPVVEAGTVLGRMKENLEKHLGVQGISVVTPAVHDTSSAAAAVPAEEGENWAFLATGSWFLMSMELDAAADMEKSYKYQLSNTGLACGKVLLKKNIMAMWLVQECKRQWEHMGYRYTYQELAQLASEARPFYGIIDVGAERFYHPECMINEILAFLKETGQRVPKIHEAGQIIRILYESITLKSAEALDILKDTTGKSVDSLYVIGGASRVGMLNQFLADAAQVTVKTGPVEATAMGNALLQAYGMGEVASMEEMRSIARRSCEVIHYQPQESGAWKEQFEKYKEICNRR